MLRIAPYSEDPSPRYGYFRADETLPARTRFYIGSSEAMPEGPLKAIRGNGWHIEFVYPVIRADGPRHHGQSVSFDYDRNDIGGRIMCRPFVVVCANSQNTALRIAQLVRLGLFILQGNAPDIDDPISEDRERLTGWHSTEGYFVGANIAKGLSANADAEVAAIRYYLSCKMYFRHFLDTHPRFGGVIHSERSRYEAVAMAAAITSAYGAIEQLGLDPKPTNDNPLFLENGYPNPRHIEATRARLERIANIPQQETTIWLLRGRANSFERRHYLPVRQHQHASWTAPGIRDRDIPMALAIMLSKRIRNKVTAHVIDLQKAKLRAEDVINIQHLVRSILLYASGEGRLLPTSQWARAERGERPGRPGGLNWIDN